jgi:hypothetical protein
MEPNGISSRLALPSERKVLLPNQVETRTDVAVGVSQAGQVLLVVKSGHNQIPVPMSPEQARQVVAAILKSCEAAEEVLGKKAETEAQQEWAENLRKDAADEADKPEPDLGSHSIIATPEPFED